MSWSAPDMQLSMSVVAFSLAAGVVAVWIGVRHSSSRRKKKPSVGGFAWALLFLSGGRMRRHHLNLRLNKKLEKGRIEKSDATAASHEVCTLHLGADAVDCSTSRGDQFFSESQVARNDPRPIELAVPHC